VRFDILCNLMCEMFLILRRTEWDMIKMYSSLYVKYPLYLSDFSDTWIFSTYFRKILRYKISWKSVHRGPSCSMRTDRQTDIRDESNSHFSQFCDRSQQETVCENEFLFGFFNSGLPYGRFVLGKCEVTSVRRTRFLDDNRTRNLNNN